MPINTDSYTSIAEADAYWADRNDSVWSGLTDEQKTAGLIRATEWIDNSFTWIGKIAVSTQKLNWPRQNVVDNQGREIANDTIPESLKNAVAWLAAEAYNKELSPALKRGGAIDRLKAGSVEVQYNSAAPGNTTYNHLFRILKNLIVGSKTTRKLVRT